MGLLFVLLRIVGLTCQMKSVGLDNPSIWVTYLTKYLWNIVTLQQLRTDLYLGRTVSDLRDLTELVRT